MLNFNVMKRWQNWLFVLFILILIALIANLFTHKISTEN